MPQTTAPKTSTVVEVKKNKPSLSTPIKNQPKSSEPVPVAPKKDEEDMSCTKKWLCCGACGVSCTKDWWLGFCCGAITCCGLLYCFATSKEEEEEEEEFVIYNEKGIGEDGDVNGNDDDSSAVKGTRVIAKFLN